MLAHCTQIKMVVIQTLTITGHGAPKVNTLYEIKCSVAKTRDRNCGAPNVTLQLKCSVIQPVMG